MYRSDSSVYFYPLMTPQPFLLLLPAFFPPPSCPSLLHLAAATVRKLNAKRYQMSRVLSGGVGLLTPIGTDVGSKYVFYYFF